MPKKKVEEIFPTRLKQARKLAGLSQAELGVRAGIGEESSSARMNQYERGVHEPDYGMVTRLAGVLGVPVSFLYEPDDVLANVILAYGKLEGGKRKKVLALFHTLQDA